MLKSIIIAAAILLSIHGDGQAREVVYGYYTPLFADEEPSKPPPTPLPPPPEIYIPLFPPEIWKLILQDFSITDLAKVAQVCKGLEKVTRQIDQLYLPKLAHQSRDLAFFKRYMMAPIFIASRLCGTLPSPLKDVHTMLGSYQAIYDSGYMIDAFTPERVKAHDEAITKVEQGLKEAEEKFGNSFEAVHKKSDHIKKVLEVNKTFIFPFHYRNPYGKIKSMIELCRDYSTAPHFRDSFYYPFSIEYALWKRDLYLNQHWLLLLSKAVTKPPLTQLAIESIPMTQCPSWLLQMTTLKSLSLERLGLSELPIGLSKLTNLVKLYLTANNLSKLPIELSKLTNLVELHLNGNNLSKLPRELSTLQSLRYLELSSNNLRHIPPVIATFTNLSNLYLRWNSLKDLQTDIEHLKPLTNLKYLDLRHNHLTDINFLSKLIQLTKLEDIDLSYNKVRSIPEWVTSLRGLNDKKLTINLEDNSWQASLKSVRIIHDFIDLFGFFIRYSIPLLNPTPSSSKKPEYNTNPKVEVHTD